MPAGRALEIRFSVVRKRGPEVGRQASEERHLDPMLRRDLRQDSGVSRASALSGSVTPHAASTIVTVSVCTFSHS